MTVADRIRDKRIELSLSQDELAHRLGYKDKTSISKIENSGNDISMKKVAKVAEALCVTPAYLMGWGDKSTVDVPSQEEEDQIRRALELYNRYSEAIPEIQDAVDRLLKSSQHNP